MSEKEAPPIDADEATDQLLDASGSVTIDVNTGVYGHRVTMADHDPVELERFRRMATIVGFEERPPQVTTALALSGIRTPIAALVGRAEAEMVERFLRLRDALARRSDAADRSEDLTSVQTDAMRSVNEYFKRVITAAPSINQYLDSVASAQGSAAQ